MDITEIKKIVKDLDETKLALSFILTWNYRIVYGYDSKPLKVDNNCEEVMRNAASNYLKEKISNLETKLKELVNE